jgi:hypothetical protein
MARKNVGGPAVLVADLMHSVISGPGLEKFIWACWKEKN